MIHWMKEAAELAALATGLYLLVALLGHRVDGWRASFRRRRLRVFTACAAAVVLAQVVEEVIGRESDALDEAVLLAIHAATPPALTGSMRMITVTASGTALGLALAAAAAMLLAARRRRDAVQLVLTGMAAGAAIWLGKTATGRVRPALWDTEWYWGSSFPSGHTLAAAAIATGACLLLRHAPFALRAGAVVIAAAWVGAVACSRLVLGVHWPTDVVAAACAGLLVAVAVHTALWRWWPRGHGATGEAEPRKAKGPTERVR
jgi:undecaprenyl-diphosphatase